MSIYCCYAVHVCYVFFEVLNDFIWNRAMLGKIMFCAQVFLALPSISPPSSDSNVAPLGR